MMTIYLCFSVVFSIINCCVTLANATLPYDELLFVRTAEQNISP